MNRRNIIRIITITLLPLFLIPHPEISLAQSPSPQTPDEPTVDWMTFIPFVLTNTPPVHSPTSRIINHGSISEFDQIPDSYIQAASALKFLFRHASVGNNISSGLDCLMNKIQPRPSFCDRDIPPDQVIYNSKYNRNNWTFEFHSIPNINPGWENKVNFFIDRVDHLGPNEDYDVVGFKFGYVDGLQGASIDTNFFLNNRLPNIYELESLEARNPNKIVVYWTMGLSRLTYSDSQQFNHQIRDFAITKNKYLVDIADILSHRHDGTPCFDNATNRIEAICDDYTDEINGGHLNAMGMQRMAKAVWLFMSSVAGWNGLSQ